MKIYELTLENLQDLIDGYKHITGAKVIDTLNFQEVLDELIKHTSFELRPTGGKIPNMKLLLRREPTGDLVAKLMPNRYQGIFRGLDEDPTEALALKKQFEEWAGSYISAHTKQGLP